MRPQSDDVVTARIGILGGSFDPIHYGHLAAAETARAALNLTRVLFVPTGRRPGKARDSVAAPGDRLAMARLACAGDDLFDVSPIELDRPGVSYTVDTLEQLHAASYRELHIILGADVAIGLPGWRAAERIIELAWVVIVERPGIPLNAAALVRRLPALRERLTVLEGPRLDISSSVLRRCVEMGRSIRYQTPDAVVAYIAANGLYRVATGDE